MFGVLLLTYHICYVIFSFLPPRHHFCITQVNCIMYPYIHRLSLVVVCIIGLSISGNAQHIIHQARYTNITASDVLYYVNQFRHKKRLPPLTMNNYIAAEAERHSRDMASGRTAFGHGGFDGRMHRIMNKFAPSGSGAENVAYGNVSAEAVVNMWIHSPGHRRNMLGNYNLTGIGIASGRGGTLYFTQIFLYKK